MIGFLSGNEAIIVVAVILLLFGSSQVPKLARNLGKAQKEFKDGLDEGNASGSADTDQQSGGTDRSEKAES